MRIHTNGHKMGDLFTAARVAGVSFAKIEKHGSRKRDRAFEVKLEGSSNRDGQGYDSHCYTYKAATWDEWGVFLAHLFAADPDMTTPYYLDAHDFAFQTNSRFLDKAWGSDEWEVVKPHDMGVCLSHNWKFSSYGTMRCAKCSAVQRRKI